MKTEKDTILKQIYPEGSMAQFLDQPFEEFLLNDPEQHCWDHKISSFSEMK